MEPLEFILKVRKIYLKARKVKFKSRLKIIRGTSHTVSSEAEDLFAKYCSDRLKKSSEYLILVDPQITFLESDLRNRTGRRPFCVRPDICILKHRKAVLFFDLKMDLGYKRDDFSKQVKVEQNRIYKIRGKEAKAAGKEFRISKTLKSIFVLISDQNISKEKMDEIKHDLMDLPKGKVIVLSSGIHLNADISLKEFGNLIKIKNESFEMIDSLLKGL